MAGAATRHELRKVGTIAFSSEVDTGSREENASKQKIRASVLIQVRTEKALGGFAHGVVDQRLAERPDRAGNLVAGSDDGVERRLDPRAVLFGDGQRRQQLDGMAAVARHLGQDLVVLEQWHRNQL